jgi:hypothetical protein
MVPDFPPMVYCPTAPFSLPRLAGDCLVNGRTYCYYESDRTPDVVRDRSLAVLFAARPKVAYNHRSVKLIDLPLVKKHKATTSTGIGNAVT